jgi:hypothetical protein
MVCNEAGKPVLFLHVPFARHEVQHSAEAKEQISTSGMCMSQIRKFDQILSQNTGVSWSSSRRISLNTHAPIFTIHISVVLTKNQIGSSKISAYTPAPAA